MARLASSSPASSAPPTTCTARPWACRASAKSRSGTWPAHSTTVSQAIHRQCPQAQGLCWISRQDDTARAVVLFGDRIPAEALRPGGGSRSLLDDGEACDAVLDLADRIGVHVVPGH